MKKRLGKGEQSLEVCNKNKFSFTFSHKALLDR